MKPSIYALIVNYNGYEDTIECLHSLKAQTGVTCRPLVIDNASANDSVSRIRAAHPQVEMLVTQENLGFAGGNNFGIQHALEAGCDYLFLVNNDTTLEPDCLQKMLSCVQAQTQAAVVVPAMYYQGDKTKPWFTGSTMDMKTGTFRHQEVDVRSEKATSPFSIPWATGCAMLMPVGIVRQIGSFDERFFCYYEDVDWSLRAQEKGYECVLCPEAILYHKVFGTSGNIRAHRYYYEARNKLLCLSKHTSGLERRGVMHNNMWIMLRRITRMAISPRAGESRRMACAYGIGLMDYYLGRFGRRQYAFL